MRLSCYEQIFNAGTAGMNQGFVVVAQNTKTTNYIKCAEALAMSVLWTMPDAKISLITDQDYSNTVFDQVIKFPHGDLAKNSDWKLDNDWQVYAASPYEYTIKLEADIYLPRSIDFWWDVLVQRDLVIATTIRDFKNQISNCRVYRRFIDDNKLPDCYNAITYFKKSKLASEFYQIVRDVFLNWAHYKQILKCNDQELATTDWAYAIASHILGPENTTLPSYTQMSMIHMKQFVNGLPTEDWTDSLVYEILPNTLRINTFPQMYPVHYHIKSFASKLLESTYG